jgi:hypothetical protein
MKQITVPTPPTKADIDAFIDFTKTDSYRCIMYAFIKDTQLMDKISNVNDLLGTCGHLNAAYQSGVIVGRDMFTDFIATLEEK